MPMRSDSLSGINIQPLTVKESTDKSIAVSTQSNIHILGKSNARILMWAPSEEDGEEHCTVNCWIVPTGILLCATEIN